MTSAAGFGLATIAADGTVLDAWFPDPELGAYSPSGTTVLAGDEGGGDLGPACTECCAEGTARRLPP